MHAMQGANPGNFCAFFCLHCIELLRMLRLSHMDCNWNAQANYAKSFFPMLQYYVQHFLEEKSGQVCDNTPLKNADP